MIGPIAILLAEENSKRSLLKEEVYRKSYQLLAEFADKRSIDLRFVQGKKYYKNGTFEGYWKFERSKFIFYPVPFKARLVLLQTRYIGLTFEKRVNNPFLEHVCRDKLRTAQLFRKYSKKNNSSNENH